MPHLASGTPTAIAGGAKLDMKTAHHSGQNNAPREARSVAPPERQVLTAEADPLRGGHRRSRRAPQATAPAPPSVLPFSNAWHRCQGGKFPHACQGRLRRQLVGKWRSACSVARRARGGAAPPVALPVRARSSTFGRPPPGGRLRRLDEAYGAFDCRHGRSVGSVDHRGHSQSCEGTPCVLSERPRRAGRLPPLQVWISTLPGQRTE